MKSGRFAKILVFEKDNVLRVKISNALGAVRGVSMMMMTGDFDMVEHGAGGCRPDIIMMDITQAMTYREKLGRVMSGRADLRLVLYSDNTTEEYRRCAREIGALTVVDFMDLVGAVGPIVDELAAAAV